MLTKSAKQLIGSVPKELLNQLILAAISKLDLVPREEFDIQTQVLQRSFKKIKELEAKINTLEQKYCKSD